MSAPFVFDSSPLSRFARAGQLEILQAICSGSRCVVTNTVREEIERGAHIYPPLRDVLDADWLEQSGSYNLAVLGFFAEYARALTSSREGNLGEAATLAWAEAHGAIAITDDQAAVDAGRQRGVEMHGTLWLVARGLKTGVMDESAAVRLVEELLKTGPHFPFSSAEGFLPWARSEGLIG